MSDRTFSLSKNLLKERNESILRQAAIVRDWQEGPERSEQAKTLIRQALVDWTLGKISQETESQLYTILSFAMPDSPSNKSRNYETEYQQQLDRQHCSECGDGVCPTEE